MDVFICLCSSSTSSYDSYGGQSNINQSFDTKGPAFSRGCRQIQACSAPWRLALQRKVRTPLCTPVGVRARSRLHPGLVRYQALREKFDQVNAEHEDWERKLELANTRIKKLQAENEYVCRLFLLHRAIAISIFAQLTHSLLLDAISITVPATPSLLHLIRPSPTSMTPGSTPLHAQHQQATGQVPPHHMNGHTYSHSNGKYREKETDRLEPIDPMPHGHEPTTNGHPS
ncbi:hypothetical protein J3A83DRAFT_4309821 [Scleroderma citrinum]